MTEHETFKMEPVKLKRFIRTGDLFLAKQNDCSIFEQVYAALAKQVIIIYKSREEFTSKNTNPLLIINLEKCLSVELSGLTAKNVGFLLFIFPKEMHNFCCKSSKERDMWVTDINLALEMEGDIDTTDLYSLQDFSTTMYDKAKNNCCMKENIAPYEQEIQKSIPKTIFDQNSEESNDYSCQIENLLNDSVSDVSDQRRCCECFVSAKQFEAEIILNEVHPLISNFNKEIKFQENVNGSLPLTADNTKDDKEFFLPKDVYDSSNVSRNLLTNEIFENGLNENTFWMKPEFFNPDNGFQNSSFYDLTDDYLTDTLTPNWDNLSLSKSPNQSEIEVSHPFDDSLLALFSETCPTLLSVLDEVESCILSKNHSIGPCLKWHLITQTKHMFLNIHQLLTKIRQFYPNDCFQMGLDIAFVVVNSLKHKISLKHKLMNTIMQYFMVDIIVELCRYGFDEGIVWPDSFNDLLQGCVERPNLEVILAQKYEHIPISSDYQDLIKRLVPAYLCLCLSTMRLTEEVGAVSFITKFNISFDKLANNWSFSLIPTQYDKCVVLKYLSAFCFTSAWWARCVRNIEKIRSTAPRQTKLHLVDAPHPIDSFELLDNLLQVIIYPDHTNKSDLNWWNILADVDEAFSVLSEFMLDNGNEESKFIHCLSNDQDLKDVLKLLSTAITKMKTQLNQCHETNNLTIPLAIQLSQDDDDSETDV